MEKSYKMQQTSNQVGDCFKLLWPFHNIRTLIEKKYFQLFSGMRLDLDYVIECLTPVQMVDRPSGGPVLPRDVSWTSL